MSKEINKAVELLITCSQMNLVSEQAEMIKGNFRHKQKHDFNTWLNLGNKLLNNLKKDLTEGQVQMFENMTDVYHEQSDSIRKQMTEG